jgi:hypothetical protein
MGAQPMPRDTSVSDIGLDPTFSLDGDLPRFRSTVDLCSLCKEGNGRTISAYVFVGYKNNDLHPISVQ